MLYTAVYQAQDTLHSQAKHALSTWGELVSLALLTSTNVVRETVIQTFFNELKEKPYAWVKSCGASVLELDISSDLDVVVEKNEVSAIVRRLEDNLSVQKVNQRNYSSMVQLELFLIGGEFLAIDLIFDFKRNGYSYLDAGEVMKQAVLNSDRIKVASSLDDAMYITHFYLLNGAPIPEKYVAWLATLSVNLQSTLATTVGSVYGVSVQSWVTSLAPKNIAIGRRYFARRLARNPLNYMWSMTSYVIDLVKRKMLNKQPIISFTGVDGAGKSTVLFTIKEQLEGRFRKEVKVLRHRPSLLPIISSIKYGKAEAERRTTLTLPRQGSNNSRLSSVLRYGYYLLDYVIGQIVIWFHYSLRGKVVLYDRYVYDFLVDPKRSNLNLPQWVRQVGAWFVADPHLNVFLYANPETILGRKKELTKEEIEQLTFSYSSLFNSKNKQTHSKKFVSIENTSLRNTVDTILRHYTSIA
jgi:thymidylate kinase